METISEKLNEISEYPRSLLVIDVDSLAGVSVSVSESGMGPSSSYSVTNTKLFSFVVHIAKTKPIFLEDKQIWVALVC